MSEYEFSELQIKSGERTDSIVVALIFRSEDIERTPLRFSMVLDKWLSPGEICDEVSELASNLEDWKPDRD